MSEEKNGFDRVLEKASVWVVRYVLPLLMAFIAWQAIEIDGKLRVMAERETAHLGLIQANTEKLVAHEEIIKDHDRSITRFEEVAKSIDRQLNDIKAELRRNR